MLLRQDLHDLLGMDREHAGVGSDLLAGVQYEAAYLAVLNIRQFRDRGVAADIHVIFLEFSFKGPDKGIAAAFDAGDGFIEAQTHPAVVGKGHLIRPDPVAHGVARQQAPQELVRGQPLQDRVEGDIILVQAGRCNGICMEVQGRRPAADRLDLVEIPVNGARFSREIAFELFFYVFDPAGVFEPFSLRLEDELVL